MRADRDNELILRNRLKEIRTEQGLSQARLTEMVGVSRNTISSMETGQFNPTAKLALILCIARDRSFEDVFCFDTSNHHWGIAPAKRAQGRKPWCGCRGGVSHCPGMSRQPSVPH